MYDLHDTQARKPGDYIAGGSHNNGDNSVGSGTYNASSTNYCMQPASGTQVPAGGSVGGLGLAMIGTLALMLGSMMWRPRRIRRHRFAEGRSR
jgi:hypothetical protein